MKKKVDLEHGKEKQIPANTTSGQGFFSNFLMGGLNFFRPLRSPSGTKSNGGRLTKSYPLKPNIPPKLNLSNI